MGGQQVTQDRRSVFWWILNEVWILVYRLGLMFCLDNRRVDAKA